MDIVYVLIENHSATPTHAFLPLFLDNDLGFNSTLLIHEKNIVWQLLQSTKFQVSLTVIYFFIPHFIVNFHMNIIIG